MHIILDLVFSVKKFTNSGTFTKLFCYYIEITVDSIFAASPLSCEFFTNSLLYDENPAFLHEIKGQTAILKLVRTFF